MKVDPDIWLLATAGAALMATGGAFLRSAFAGPRARRAAPRRPATSLLCLPCSQRPPDAQTEAEMAALRQSSPRPTRRKKRNGSRWSSSDNAPNDRCRAPKLKSSDSSEELEAEKSRVTASDSTTKELRTKLAGTEEELRRSKAHASDPKALVSLQSEVTEAQKKLKTATEERDAARSKVEALERLVEGVRARSRELTEELKTLKGQ